MTSESSTVIPDPIGNPNRFYVRLALISTIFLSLSAPAIAKPVILMLGDSLTEGYGLAAENATPALLQKQLRGDGFPEMLIINAGIGGSTSASGLQRLKWHLKGKQKPDILLLALGANDGLRGLPVPVIRRNLSDVITYAQSRKIQVLLGGVQIPPNYGPDYAKSFAGLYPSLAKEYKVSLLPFLLQGVAANPTLNLSDGIHPNEKGHRIITETVRQYLLPMLKKGATKK